MSFTAHNISFEDGTETLPDASWRIADSPWTFAALRALRLCYGYRLAGRSIVDLGCLEGGYTLEFARAGMRATGLEVRRSNFENCLQVERKAGLPDLTFINDDVWNLPAHGSFDAAFCCGLLYHLDRPAAFIRLMAQCVRDIIILNTHFAAERNHTAFNLSPPAENEGLPGRWFPEHDLDDTASLEQHKWASWRNKRSFWLTKPALLQVLSESGFTVIYEQYDMLGPNIRSSMETGFYAEQGRSMFVAMRS
jgi:SAM-dependent methyltransferase